MLKQLSSLKERPKLITNLWKREGIELCLILKSCDLFKLKEMFDKDVEGKKIREKNQI